MEYTLLGMRALPRLSNFPAGTAAGAESKLAVGTPSVEPAAVRRCTYLPPTARPVAAAAAGTQWSASAPTLPGPGMRMGKHQSSDL